MDMTYQNANNTSFAGLILAAWIRKGARLLVLPALGLAWLACPSSPAAAENLEVRVNGLGYVQAGRIMHSSDSIDYNYNGNWFQKAAAQITAHAQINKNLEGALGIGARQAHKAQERLDAARRLQVGVEPYISEARFTYTRGDIEAPSLQITFGYFPYNYNPSVRNLGLYLLRGTVYPGFLFSGFETDETMPIANTLGARLHGATGPFQHDVILSSQTNVRPLFDYSLAYIGRYANSVFEIGAGVNFYRLIPIVPELTTPRDTTVFTERYSDSEILSKYDRNHLYIENTPTGPDTTRFTLKGTKLASFMSLDLKALTGQGAMGDKDLKLYSEVALIGVKSYKGIYDDILQRIPVMLGFNIPAFKLLDHLSLEVEWYGAPYRNDYQKLENEYSPIPVSNQNLQRVPETDSTGQLVISRGPGESYPYADPFDVENMVQDNWKWSLHGAKTIKNQIRISAQLANDHFRTGGSTNSDTFESAFSTLKDWYWMTKISYFF